MVSIAPTKPLSSALQLESLTHIDIAKLSQSELYSLSLCSSSSFDLRHPDDVIIPNIERSHSNESGGDRPQTYPRSRLRHRPRFHGLLSSSNKKSSPSDDLENKFIIRFLKQLVNPNSPPTHHAPLVLPGELLDNELSRASGHEAEISVNLSERKRKRERKSKAKILQENGAGIKLEMVNRDGVAVDLSALEVADDLYSVELIKRTVGKETEEEILGFLRGLEGQWCSRRKKRKIVDASEFGDSLPIGWKLLLGLRRREGRVSVYCRRYISPTGKHLLSCKEAAVYLRSCFGGNDANRPMEQNCSSIQQEERSNFQYADSADNIVDNNLDMIKSLTTASPSATDAKKREISLPGIGNLAEVQVRDLFECYKCNMSFEERDEYLQHLLSFHQKTNRKYKVGISVGEGVIIRDGKYECQFCHKVFQERRSYNGHVGIHVRNYVRGSEDLPAIPASQWSGGSASFNELSSRTSKMNALVEVAQNSASVNSIEGNEEGPVDSTSKKPNVDSASNMGAGSSKIKDGDCMVDRNVDEPLNHKDSECTLIGGEIVKTDEKLAIDNSVSMVCADFPEHKEIDEPSLNISFVKFQDDLPDNIPLQSVQENPVQNIVNSSVALVQSIDSCPASTSISNKRENELDIVDPKLHNVMGLDEVRFEELEPLKYTFVNEQGSSFQGMSMEVMGEEMDGEYNSCVRFEETDIIDRHQVSSLCVWCRTQFLHEVNDTDVQSGSIEFICPSCKLKIPVHLEDDLPMDSHGF